MARKTSVILTPIEKKLAVSDAKIALKDAKTSLAGLLKARKDIESDYAKAVKLSDRLIKGANADVQKLEAGFLALSPPKATPSPVA
jgi:hypothetical protein